MDAEATWESYTTYQLRQVLGHLCKHVTNYKKKVENNVLYDVLRPISEFVRAALDRSYGSDFSVQV